MKKTYHIAKKDNNKVAAPMKSILICCCGFMIGCIFTASVILNVKVNSSVDDSTAGEISSHSAFAAANSVKCLPSSSSTTERRIAHADATTAREPGDVGSAVLRDLKILVVIAAFDFSQLPHLEEVIGAYHDLCAAGSHVDVMVHTTVAYPVTLIDLLNTRVATPLCPDSFSLTIAVKPKSLRLFLVDEHRKVFYDKIHQYDLFIYTEDDIRVTPTTVATYVLETQRIQSMLSLQKGGNNNNKLKPSDFNVGIVRYEYNYPANVVMDDNTRHATQNVTRVYWEHSGFERPVVGNAVKTVNQDPLFTERYITMNNHHQGMFLATRELLLAWKDRGPKCDFANARPRPGKNGQPTEGTQRVWMSSQMLYGSRHCGVQQVLPKDAFGALTVLHLPNKNYRRVGKYRNRQFSDGTEVFEQPHESLLTAMELHLSVRRELSSLPQLPYRGIRMVDEVNQARDRTPLLERRMREFEEYVKRGGVLSEYDNTKIDLVEDA